MRISGTQHNKAFVARKTLAQLEEEKRNDEARAAALEADLAAHGRAMASGELSVDESDGEGIYIGVPAEGISAGDAPPMDEAASVSEIKDGERSYKFVVEKGMYVAEDGTVYLGEPIFLPDWRVPTLYPLTDNNATPMAGEEEKGVEDEFSLEKFNGYLENLGDEGVKAMSHFIYDQYLEQIGPNHLLRRIADYFGAKFRLMAAKCANFYKPNAKAGREAHYTVEQLCRGIVLKALYGWSLRRTEEEIRSNLLNRWFVGIPINQPTPDHSTLYNFENWLIENHPRLLFTEILKQIDEDFPEEREAIQYGDTFAMYTRAAAVSRTVMIRQCASYLLQEIAKIYPDEDERLQEAEFWGELFGPEGEKREYLLSIDERKARDVATARAAYPVLAQVRSHLATLNPVSPKERDKIEKWLELLKKILQDDFEFTLDEAGNVVHCQLRVTKVKGAYRLGSAVDPEATFRKHGDKSDLGYNVNLAVTANFVREIQAYTGATPDAAGVAALAGAQLEHMGFAPAMLAYDQAAGFPKYIADVHKASGEQTLLVVRLVRQGKTGKFAPDDFTLNEDKNLVCPNGVTSTKFYRSSSSDGWQYRFTKKQCEGCPLIDPCRGGKMNGHRKVTISDYTYQRREAIAFQQTDEFEAIMRNRSTVERVLSGVVRYNDARQAKGYGLNKADYQARMGAMAYNLKRWATLTHKKQRKIYRIDPHAPPIEGDELWI